ncbi:MAG: response regulator transcription factor, partial [Silvibacterium sp.]
MSEPIRILVVDDHAIVRKGLVALLNSVPGLSVVGEAADGEEAIQAHRVHQPDITLMDLRLPKIGGA